MTPNPTIDGVPGLRELLGRIANPYRREPRSIHLHNADIAELRALLDKEVSGDSRAPLPQGKPVAHTLHSVAQAVEASDCYTVLTSNQCHSLARSLNKQQARNAEQPAPVAVVLPERKSVNTHNSHDWDEGHADGWVAYDTELKRLNPSL